LITYYTRGLTSCPRGREDKKMVEINWERDFKTALEKAKKTDKPIYHDFWFDG
jgi:hypothetical protein